MYKVEGFCSTTQKELVDQINEFLRNQMPSFDLIDIKFIDNRAYIIYEIN